jgi:protein NirF
MVLATNLIAAVVLALAACEAPEPRGTGDLGLIVERAAGRIHIVETTTRTRLRSVDGLGDLSHASAVFSRDSRFAFVFGRDGGLTKLDMLTGEIAARRMQAGNSIGGAISQDGRIVAVANYEPGGVNFYASDDLAPIAEIPATFGAHGARSKVVGLEDLPGNRFIFSLYDAGEIWIAEPDGGEPRITRFLDVGQLPYDALITPDGRHYLAGLFGEDGLAHIDLWQEEVGVRRILDGYGRGEEPLPVYKMPHLKGWGLAGNHLFLPAVGRHELLVVARDDWRLSDRVALHGQPVFAIARPDGRQVWVNFAPPHNDVVQVIDVPSREVIASLELGPGVLHMEFTPRGEEVWISIRDENRVVVLDTDSFATRAELPVESPSGIFFTSRAHRTGF